MDESRPLRDVFRKIMEIRDSYGVDHKLHFSELSGKKWYLADAATREVLEVAVDSLRHKGSQHFAAPLCARLAIIFYPASEDLHAFGYGGKSRAERLARYDETMLRILLKGALHYLYPESAQVVVRGIVADGDSSARRLDRDRVITEMLFDEFHGRTPLMGHISFHEDAKIVHVVSNHRRHAKGSSRFVHSNLLQVADLMLGAAIRACAVGCSDYVLAPRVGQSPVIKKDAIGYPMKRMLSKTSRGAGFKHSGHYRAFSVARVDFEDRGPCFHSVNVKQLEVAGAKLLWGED